MNQRHNAQSLLFQYFREAERRNDEAIGHLFGEKDVRWHRQFRRVGDTRIERVASRPPDERSTTELIPVVILFSDD